VSALLSLVLILARLSRGIVILTLALCDRPRCSEFINGMAVVFLSFDFETGWH